MDQRKAFHRQRLPEFSCAKKKTVDIDIFGTSRTADRKVMFSIRITSRPTSRIRKPGQMSIYQSNTYRKDLNWQTGPAYPF